MKWLILQYINTIDDMVSFKVDDQSHRGLDFGQDGSYPFIAKDGFGMESMSLPEFAAECDNCLYVRGRDERRDNDIVFVPIDTWHRIKEAVQEYNDYFRYNGECILNEIPSPILPDDLFTL